MQLGEILKLKREELNLTQEAVGNKLYVTRQTISNWENGKTLPDIDSLIDIATFYNLSLDTILLKGSDVVEDIKRKERLANLNKWSYIPIFMFLILIFLLYRSIRENNIPNMLATAILSTLVLAILLFFDSQIKEAKGLRKNTKKLVIIMGCFAFLGVIIGVLITYFDLFNL